MAPFELKFASRLNSFAVKPELFWQPVPQKITIFDLLARAAMVSGLTHVDLNYPTHFEALKINSLTKRLNELGLTLHGFEMRYYGNPLFSLGAFTNPNPKTRQQALDLTLKAVDDLAAAGGKTLTIWPGQDGFDYSFQADYSQIYDYLIEALRKVAQRNQEINISLEYKPSEPRAFSILPDVGTTLLAIRDAQTPNLGITLDFCHMLFAGEHPAASAALSFKQSKVFGVHLNDGYSRRDDGLMVGSVHLVQTLEFLLALRENRYQGVIYFDTFPFNEDPVKECQENINMVKKLSQTLDRLDSQSLVSIRSRQDSIAAQKLLLEAFFSPSA
jgi:xylose isomerase